MKLLTALSPEPIFQLTFVSLITDRRSYSCLFTDVAWWRYLGVRK